MSSNGLIGRESSMTRRPSTWASTGGADCRGTNPDSLGERQRHFATALLNPAMRVPAGLIGPDRDPSEKRFNVYRNNVVIGLIDALKAAFPAVCRIVGDEFFTAMARVYVAHEPPTTPVMLDYGGTFPDFIGRFEPARSVPYLADVARLERAWVQAYHAAEAQPLDPAQLAMIEAPSLPHLVLKLHPSVRVVRSSFAVVQIWSMNIEGGIPVAIDLASGGESALVVRPHAEVEVRRLPDGAATFIEGLTSNLSVAEAAALAFDEFPTFDLTGALQELFMIHAITGWHRRDDTQFSPLARNA
jgi:hypothetical protein